MIERFRHWLETMKYRRKLKRLRWKIREIERSEIPVELKAVAIARIEQSTGDSTKEFIG